MTSRQSRCERWHGTAGGYSNHDCRCDDCKAAWREAVKERRWRKYSGPCKTPGCTRKASHAEGSGYCVPCTRALREDVLSSYAPTDVI